MSTTDPTSPWTFEISGRGRPLSSSLREIPRYRDLLLLFTRRDLVSEFKQTLLGPLWILIRPALTTVAFAVVFGGIAQLGSEDVPDLLFYLLGVTFWGLFSTTFGAVANLFAANEHIFSKVYFPRLVSMLSTALARLLIFFVQLAVFAIVVLIAYRDVLSERLNAAALLIPFVIVLLSALACGLGLLVAASTVRYRDFRKTIAFGTQLMLYATPVIYASEDVPSGIAQYLRFNPLNAPFDALRWGLFDSEPVSVGELAYSSLVALAILAFGISAFHRVEQSFVDEI